MTNFEKKKNLIEKEIKKIFNLPMVAISQRSIPKDQLHENKRKIKLAMSHSTRKMDRL